MKKILFVCVYLVLILKSSLSSKTKSKSDKIIKRLEIQRIEREKNEFLEHFSPIEDESCSNNIQDKKYNLRHGHHHC